jgi:hypothetical protein
MHGGKATTSLTLNVDQDLWMRGPSVSKVSGYGLTVSGVSIGGTLHCTTSLELNPRLGMYRLNDAKLQLRDTRFRTGDESSEGWWLDATSKRLEVRDGARASFESTLSLRARDLSPVLEALSEKDAITGLIPRLVSLHDFRSKLTLRTRSPVLDIVMESESDVWDASGRFYFDGKRQQLALVVGGQAISLGIASENGALSLMPFAKTGWLNEQLARFPKPLVALPPSKP